MGFRGHLGFTDDTVQNEFGAFAPAGVQIQAQAAFKHSCFEHAL